MTTIGPDYASVDANAVPNFPAAKHAGARFVIVRAIYGRPLGLTDNKSPFRDPVWVRDKAAIKAAGLGRGAYLFICYPKSGVYTPPPEEQAQAYIDYVTLDRDQDFVPMVDVEEASDILGSTAMYDWTLRVCRVLRAHFGVWPGIYSSARAWTENLKGHAAGLLINCPLWIAKPWPWAIRTPVHLDGAPAYDPTPIPAWGDQWFFYQYQGDALDWPGFTRTVDANRFNVLSKGAKGDSVKWAQQRLKVTADGLFGPNTETAVKELQRKHGLTVDGVIGVATFAPLCWLPAG